MNTRSLLTSTTILLILIGGFFIIRHYEARNSMDMSSSAYGTDQDGVDMGATTTPATTVTASSTISVTLPTGTVKEFTISGFNFGFTPSTITVNKGDTVKITLNNTGGFHDLKIDEFNVATKRISGGQTDTVTFVATKQGSFEYYCSVGTHRQMGMKGTLIVK